MAEEQAFLQVVLGDTGADKLAHRLQDYIAAVIVRDSEEGQVEDFVDLPIVFVAQFMAGAMLRVISWWLNTPEKYSADQMTEIFYVMILRQPLPAQM